MHRSLKKAANRVKGRAEQRRGPVKKDQATAPIADAIRDYWDRGMLTFGVPAHNGGRGPAPEFTKWAGMDKTTTGLSQTSVLSVGSDRIDMERLQMCFELEE